MSQRKPRRAGKNKFHRSERQSKGSGQLSMEVLEHRLLLDVAGVWDELGWRAASGGGVSWDAHDEPSDAQFVTTSDGDPVLFWVDSTDTGTFTAMIDEYLGGSDGSGRLPFHWESKGIISASQYVSEDIGWASMGGMGGLDAASAINQAIYTDSSGTLTRIGKSDYKNQFITEYVDGGLAVCSYATEMSAVAGPNGTMAVTWVAQEVPPTAYSGSTYDQVQIYAMFWTGSEWVELDGSGSNAGVSQVDGLSADAYTVEAPDITISETGEVFISYTALHPGSGSASQREIVVKKYGYVTEDTVPIVYPPQPSEQAWVELYDEETGPFAERNEYNAMSAMGGVSADSANSFDSAIAVDLEGRPIVVWSSQLSQQNMEIFAARWDGSSWVEYGVESKSDLDGDGFAGVSRDLGVSIQPDIAITEDGRAIVTWVNWENWDQYLVNGKAGIYVKELEWNEWVAYNDDASTITGAGLASPRDDAGDIDAANSRGWYYTPSIDIDASGNPVISWQGYDAPIRKVLDRDDNDVNESPVMRAYVSHLDTTTDTFTILTNSSDYSVLSNDSTTTKDDSLADSLSRLQCWMPAVLVTPDDDILVAYSLYDTTLDGTHMDTELIAQMWDSTLGTWVEYGRGSDSNGNDYFGWENSSGISQTGLLDFDGDSDTAMDVVIASWNSEDRGQLFRYDSEAGRWYDDLTINFDTDNANNLKSFGYVFDFAGDPDYEYIDGDPLLAYLDDETGLPYVYQFSGGGWVQQGTVAGTIAGTSPFFGDSNYGISVAAGANGEVLLAYLATNPDTGTTDVMTRLWDPITGVWSAGGSDVDGWLPKNAPLSLAYYSNFNGLDFGDDGTVADSIEFNDGIPEIVVDLPEYDTSGKTVYFIPDYDESFALSTAGLNDWDTTVTASIDSTAGATVDFVALDPANPLDYTQTAEDDGLLMEFLIDDADTNINAGGSFYGQFLIPFQLPSSGDVTLQMDYSVANVSAIGGDLPGTGEASAEAGRVGIDLYLGIMSFADGSVYWFDPNNDGSVGDVPENPFVSLSASDIDYELGNQLAYADAKQIEFSSETLTDMLGADFAAGTYNLLVRAVANVGVGTEEEIVHVRFDNMAVYQSVQTAGDAREATVDIDTAFLGALDANNWCHDSVNGTTSGASGAAYGVNGVSGDGGVRIDLGPAAGVAVENNVEAKVYSAPVTATDAGTLEASLTFKLDLEEDVNEDAYIEISVHIEEVANADVPIGEYWTFRLTADDTLADTTAHTTGWITKTFDVSEMADFSTISAPTNGVVYRLIVDVIQSEANGGDGQGFLEIDEAGLVINSGDTDWCWATYNSDTESYSNTSTPDTGGNWNVGEVSGNRIGDTKVTQVDDDTPGYDFEDNLYATILNAAGSQSYTFTVTTDYPDDIVVLFRHNKTIAAASTVKVYVDGVETTYDNDLFNNSTNLEDYDSDNYSMTDAWSQGTGDTLEYAFTKAVSANVSSGTHTIEIELTGVAGDELWIDDLSILASIGGTIESTNPIAKLLSNRNFAVGSTDVSADQWVYESGEYTLMPVGQILAYGGGGYFGGGYYNPGIQELDDFDGDGTDEWDTYGQEIGGTQRIDFLGFDLYSYAMPTSDLLYLEDFAVGPNGTPWVAMRHGTLDRVELYINGSWMQYNLFVFHPWADVDAPAGVQWTVGTTDLDIQILAWEPFSGDPRESDQNYAQWVNMDLPLPADPVTNAQIVTTGGQLPIVAWTYHGPNGRYFDAATLRYNAMSQSWEAMGNQAAGATVENYTIQTNSFWSAQWVTDLIVKPDDYPIIMTYAGHLDSDAIREFRPSYSLPNMALTESSGDYSDDYILDFGTTVTQIADESFRVSNTGPGDLVIYDIELGGEGTSDVNPFTLRNAPEFPIVLEPGESRDFAVRFNPSNVEVGEYSAVAMVHTSQYYAFSDNDRRHDYSHFDEVILLAEKIEESDININEDLFDFGANPIEQLTEAQELVIENLGSDDLVIEEWFFDGDRYHVSQAYVTPFDNADAPYVVSRTNDVGSADDVTIRSGDTLSLWIQMSPLEERVYNETLYINSSDFDEPTVAVFLTGIGSSDGMISVAETSGTDNDDIIEFGSVAVNDSRSEVITISNAGTTELTIYGLSLPSSPDIVVTPLLENYVLQPGTNVALTVTYSPSPGQIAGEVQVLDTSIVIISDSADNEEGSTQSYAVSLTGLGVPNEPMLEVYEDSGTANDNRVEFGSVRVGSVGSETVEIANIGGADLVLTRIKLKNLNGDTPFTLTPAILNPSNVPVGQRTVYYNGDALSVDVSYSPTASGEYIDTMEIYYLDADGDTVVHTVELIGSGTDMLLGIVDSSGAANDRSITFASTGVNEPSATQTVTLSNLGSSNITITSVTLVDANGVFHITSDDIANTILQASGDAAVIDLNFVPNGQGSFAGQLVINTDDPENSQWIVSLGRQWGLSRCGNCQRFRFGFQSGGYHGFGGRAGQLHQDAHSDQQRQQYSESQEHCALDQLLPDFRFLRGDNPDAGPKY